MHLPVGLHLGKQKGCDMRHCPRRPARRRIAWIRGLRIPLPPRFCDGANRLKWRRLCLTLRRRRAPLQKTFVDGTWTVMRTDRGLHEVHTRSIDARLLLQHLRLDRVKFELERSPTGVAV